MPDVSNFLIGDDIYDVKDEVARKFINLYDLRKRKILFVGDSYSTGHGIATPYCDLIITELNNGSQKVALGGVGFVHNETFLGILQSNIRNIQNKESFTDVIVVGGFNDRSEDYSAIVTAIGNFYNYARSQFPNAIMHLACVGWSYTIENKNLVYSNVWSSYSEGARKNNVHYDTRLNYVLHDYSVYGDDVHPNNDGQIVLAGAIKQFLMFGDINCKYTKSVAWWVRDGQNYKASTLNFNENCIDGMCSISSGSFHITFTQQVNFAERSGTALLMKPRNSGCLSGDNTNAFNLFPVLYYNHTKGTYGTGMFYMVQGTVNSEEVTQMFFYPLEPVQTKDIQFYDFIGYFPAGRS